MADDVTDATDTPADETADAASAPAEVAEGAAEEAAEETAEAPAASTTAKEKPAARPPVARRTVQSRRVTPKGGPTKASSVPKEAPLSASKARDAKKTAEVVDRAVHAPKPPAAYAKGPSPWWVPALMFGLLILGALLIVANYAGAFGDPDNIYLVVGLGFILGGIVTATQYR